MGSSEWNQKEWEETKRILARYAEENVVHLRESVRKARETGQPPPGTTTFDEERRLQQEVAGLELSKCQAAGITGIRAEERAFRAGYRSVNGEEPHSTVVGRELLSHAERIERIWSTASTGIPSDIRREIQDFTSRATNLGITPTVRIPEEKPPPLSSREKLNRWLHKNSFCMFGDRFGCPSCKSNLGPGSGSLNG